MDFTIRAATLDDVQAVKRLASRYSKEVGYVMYPALREAVARGELTVAVAPDGSVIGFVNWHKRRDGWRTVYEIAVAPDQLGQGVGKALINSVPGRIRLKCTVENDRANSFYDAQGFRLLEVESGRKRPLNVWIRLPRLTERERAVRAYLHFEKRCRWKCPGTPVPPSASRHLRRHLDIEHHALNTPRWASVSLVQATV